MKVVINDCFGGFSLSDKAAKICIDRGMTCSEDHRNDSDFTYSPNSYWGEYYAPNHDEKSFRTNPVVIRVVEELGKEADGTHAELSIVEIPFDDLEGWHIHEYDGREMVEENHRSWG
jgi:hypothetical protein